MNKRNNTVKYQTSKETVNDCNPTNFKLFF